MITANYKLNALDALFSAIEQIEQFDYIKLGERIIDKAIIAAAIIYGITSYIITACQLWWEDNGERIMVGTVRAIINLVDYTHELYLFGTETKRFITKTLNYCMDRVYYSAIA